MTFNHAKLGRAVTFMKHLASVVSFSCENFKLEQNGVSWTKFIDLQS